MGHNETVTCQKGRLIAHYGLKAVVELASGTIEIKPPRREKWVVGDIVHIVDGRPKKIEERRNELARYSRTSGKQILAANLDLLVIVTACGSAFKPGLVDRFFVAAMAQGIEPVIVLNKIDLPDADGQIESVSRYLSSGFSVYQTSAATCAGIDSFFESLADKTSAMVGHSGVGKTSLVNILNPSTNRATAQIHEKTGQGRHTTSNAKLIHLHNGGSIIDSPGIRQFTPAGLEPVDVARHFPGFREFNAECRFRDCIHLTEPDCAIRTAVDRKDIAPELYESYKRLIASIRENG